MNDIKNCGNCIYYTGNHEDNMAICEMREGYTHKKSWCPNHVTDTDKEQ